MCSGPNRSHLNSSLDLDCHVLEDAGGQCRKLLFERLSTRSALVGTVMVLRPYYHL